MKKNISRQVSMVRVARRCRLELDHLPLPLLVASQLEVLHPLQRHLDAPLALLALLAQHDLLRRLGLLPVRRIPIDSCCPPT